MSTEKITAETRTEFGKGAARRIRRDHKIPAVIYGHGNAQRWCWLPYLISFRYSPSESADCLSLSHTTDSRGSTSARLVSTTFSLPGSGRLSVSHVL